eukprot:274669-Chlamydomonas_euryale.AAC.2
MARDSSIDSGSCLGQAGLVEAIKTLAPLEFQQPQQVGRMTRSNARHGGSGHCCKLVIRPIFWSIMLTRLNALALIAKTASKAVKPTFAYHGHALPTRSNACHLS